MEPSVKEKTLQSLFPLFKVDRMLMRVVVGVLALHFVSLLKGEEKLFTEAPDWSVLDPFQKKITKSKFCKLLNGLLPEEVMVLELDRNFE